MHPNSMLYPAVNLLFRQMVFSENVRKSLKASYLKSFGPSFEF